jgi:hypothetical protein
MGKSVRVLLAVAAIILAAPAVAAAHPKSLHGVVKTGGTSSSRPLRHVKVTLFEATNASPRALGRATTNAAGRFSIRPRRHTSRSVFFVQANVGRRVRFVAVLGARLPERVTINELTTVAASYSMAQFFTTGVISGKSSRLRLAAGMNNDIVSPSTGRSSSVLLDSPNADQTNSLRSTRSLANALAACVGNRGVTSRLLHRTTPPGGRRSRNTAAALANLARDPGQNVDGIYALTLLKHSYAPALVTVPDAWTVAVKVNDSGSDARLISGPGNLVFDSRGYAWVLNNTIQGTAYSSRFNVVLKPNGKPSSGKNGTPPSPLLGGGILGCGFGITLDSRGSVWFGNFGWGDCTNCQPSADGNGSVSRFTVSGRAVSPSDGYQGGPLKAMGMDADRHDNIWIASNGNDSVYVFKDGNPRDSAGFEQYSGSKPFDVQVAANGTAWVTNGGGFDGTYPSSVARFKLVDGALQRQSLQFIGKALKSVALDSEGNAWVASQGDNKVYLFAPDGTEIDSFSGGGMDGPWGLVVDGDDNVWVANFGPLDLGPQNNFTGRLTELWGVHAPRGHNVGDPVTPATGYTVPSAGSEVLLHNGVRLYGPEGPRCFIPMMRQTGLNIDQAGNVWTLNNWKPDFDNDTVGGNPGGDGIVIFVGLAAPPRSVN